MFMFMKKVSVLVVFWFIVFSGCDNDKKEVMPETGQMKKIIALGDSLTAGQGVLPEEAWPALLEKKLHSAGRIYSVVNAGMSGDTTSGGLARVDWAISGGVDVFLLELGANDAMRGVPTTETATNLGKIIQIVRKKNPDVKMFLFAMKSFPNMGTRFSKDFEKIYPDVAKTEKVTLVPFFLEGVAGVRSLNQPDGIHPTAEGYEIITNTLFSFLQNRL